MSIRNLAGAALVASAPVVFADEPPTPLEPIVVTATRSEEDQNRTASALIVITHEDIARSGATQIAEVLRARAGVEVIDTFGDGSRTLVGLRGFGENAHSNSLILVDGRPLNNPDIGSADLRSIDLRDVERIEILQGSAGTLYGDQAVGGVINIVTRAPRGFTAGADIGGGSHRAGDSRAAVADRFASGWSYALSGDGLKTDNYRRHNDLRDENVLGRGGYDYGSGAAFLELGVTDQRLQTPGALLAPDVAADRRQSRPEFGGDFSNTDTYVVRTGLRQSLGDHWAVESELARRQTDGTFRLSFAGAAATADATQKRRLLDLTPRVVGHFSDGFGTALLTLGVDAGWADYRLLSQFGPQDNTQRTRAFYAQAVLPLPAHLEATAGARQARVDNELTDNFIFPNGSNLHDAAWGKTLGLAWRPAADWRLFTRYDGNFRFAKVDEFFGSSFTPGTVNLRTQTGRSLEAGTEWAEARWRTTALLYRLDLRNEIVFDPTTLLNANLDSTRRNGALIESSVKVLEPLELSASYTYLDAIVNSGALSGKDVPLVARHAGRFAADWQALQALNFLAEIQANSSRAFSGDFDNTLGRLPGFAAVNLASQLRAGAWRAGARINNLLNRKYAEFGAKAFPPPAFTPQESFFPSPERNFWITLGRDF